ncbi:MAG TPA: capsule assembly Wzi family protein [Acidobacteriaceae bacterium]
MKSIHLLGLSVALLSIPAPVALAQQVVACDPDTFPGGGSSSVVGSTYVPVDNWVYSAVDRLHALGFVDTAYLGMRPWTRRSIEHMLEATAEKINNSRDNEEACQIYRKLKEDLETPTGVLNGIRSPRIELDTTYTRVLGISGTPLRDSFHLGQTIINDYGRPYAGGFNDISGFSARGEAGRFALYFRGEYQHSPDTTGYSPALASLLSNVDGIPFASNSMQRTIPFGPIQPINQVRVVEATLSYLVANHEISFGKTDHWLGPAEGGSFAWSNNAENIYGLEIDRTEPLHIPLLSRLTGPFRYQFFVGSLKGHTVPNDPWIHAEKISFKPTENLEFGFERSVIWGGKGHEPITFDSFLRSFFSVSNVSVAQKFSRTDPGARFGTFDFSYRLPYLRRWVTVYTDSLVHDDVSPISAPRRAGIRAGVYLSRIPGIEHVDFRAEAVSTDPPTSRSNGGQFLYYETVQKQGYTNNGLLIGDAIGREGKGGQAWLTYHISPSEGIVLSYRNAKASKDFIPGGTTQNSFGVSVVKRIHRDFEIGAWTQIEQWKAPVYRSGKQVDTSTAFQITWYPHKGLAAHTPSQ